MTSTTSPRPMQTLGPDLFLKQYDTLRAEILLKMSQLAALATSTLIYPAALLAFALANRNHPLLGLAVLFPPLLSGLLTYQYYAVVAGVVRLAAHLRKMEAQVAETLPPDLAWQTSIATASGSTPTMRWQNCYFVVVNLAFVAASAAVYFAG